ncbi:MAG: AAA family ATPase [Actinomycetota bacterium]|nr:AAA family ATPase [Actinomycetota bacterium]
MRLQRPGGVRLVAAHQGSSSDRGPGCLLPDVDLGQLVLVGDPHQLGAVGPGGLFRTLAAEHGAAELEILRRFTNPSEAAASLRLRSGDAAVLGTYVAHGRIADGSRSAMCDAAFRAWPAARDRAEQLLVMAGDNATADELAWRYRAELVRRGVVERDGVAIPVASPGWGMRS